jgi:hypothetical protein
MHLIPSIRKTQDEQLTTFFGKKHHFLLFGDVVLNDALGGENSCF